MNKFLILFFISLSLSAQISGVVKDSITGQPIPYVNIWAEDETIGTISEIDGSFSLEIKEEKVLVFSALGYEIKKMSSKNEIILLTPKAFELNEVVIERPQFKKEIEIGEKLQKKAIRISDKIGNLKALYFPFRESYIKSRFIKKAKVFTQSQIVNAKFKLRVLSVNSKGFPDADLIEEENSGLKVLRTAREEQPWYSPYTASGDYKVNGTQLIRHNPLMLINEEKWNSKRYEGIGLISLDVKPFQGFKYTPSVKVFASYFEEK